MISKKIFYIGNDDDFYKNLVSSLASLQHRTNTHYTDENMGAVACINEKPDIVIFDCKTPAILKHAQDTFSYPESKGKIFFRGKLAPVKDVLYAQYCLTTSSNEREDVKSNQTTRTTLQQLGLLS